MKKEAPAFLLAGMEMGSIFVNAYILGCKTDGEAVLIDPGDDTLGEGMEWIKGEVEKEGVRVVGIINTHSHVDHIGGNRFLKELYECPLMIHEKEAEVLTMTHTFGHAFGMRVQPSPRPDRLLSGGDEICAGRLALKVIETPGHSPGGICLFEERLKILFSGDTLFQGSIGRTDLPGGDYDTLLNSIRGALLPLGDDVAVYPGHGPGTTIGHERRFNPFLR